jgi:hypothetical protein
MLGTVFMAQLERLLNCRFSRSGGLVGAIRNVLSANAA